MSRATQVVVEPGFNQSDPPEKACPGGSPKARSTEGKRGVPKLSVDPTASLFPRSRPQAFHTKVWEMEAKETSEKTKPFFEESYVGEERQARQDQEMKGLTHQAGLWTSSK